jgi:hypothetical protein
LKPSRLFKRRRCEKIFKTLGGKVWRNNHLFESSPFSPSNKISKPHNPKNTSYEQLFLTVFSTISAIFSGFFNVFTYGAFRFNFSVE